jgi:hypothetical protein
MLFQLLLHLAPEKQVSSTESSFQVIVNAGKKTKWSNQCTKYRKAKRLRK